MMECRFMSDGPCGGQPSTYAVLVDGRLLQDAERAVIEHTLTRFGWHQGRSARALGISVRTLSMRLKQWKAADASK